MAGALTHIIIAFLCLAIVYLIHFKWEYGLSIFIGNLLPDVIKFVVSGIKLGTISIFSITHTEFYPFINGITSDMTIWFTIGFFIFGLAALLYHFHYIKKKKMEEYDELYIFLLIGIIIHLILDVLIIETSPWL
jgi:hypothetical protein